LNVVYIEDDPSQSELISIWLEDEGHHITCMKDGQSFCQSIKKLHYDVFLLDWELPDTTGLE